MVTEAEYTDFSDMLEHIGLAEMDSQGDYFTWSNKHVEGTIYSRIDRVLANVSWFQNNLDVNLHIMPPNVSDHTLLWLQHRDRVILKKSHFKFINGSVDLDGYNDAVSASWREPITGRPMFVVWEKLMCLQPVLRNLSKPLMHLKQNILQARGNLQQAQLDLSIDLMNSTNIAKVKKCTDILIYFQELEENVLRQKAKIDWLKLGDGNNSFFYATVKSRANAKGMNMLRKIDGTICATQEDIENLVLEFYGDCRSVEMLMQTLNTFSETTGLVSDLGQKDRGKFSMKTLYLKMRCEGSNEVVWNRLFCGNPARPRALMTLWQACHGRLPTKDRLLRFGMLGDKICCFCEGPEFHDHLFFGCSVLGDVWKQVLEWIQVKHHPQEWNEKQKWIIRHSKGKGHKASILKLAVTETVYGIWKYRNAKIFEETVDNTNIVDYIIDNIVYRGWYNNKLKSHIAHFMMF
ncbi:hypothetical protein GmHk_17G049445 [Glycine max]|nr:hypothetical protein GmHk_17G049445 [Glycine max]